LVNIIKLKNFGEGEARNNYNFHQNIEEAKIVKEAKDEKWKQRD